MAKEKKKYGNLNCTQQVKMLVKKHCDKTGEKEYRFVDRVLKSYFDIPNSNKPKV